MGRKDIRSSIFPLGVPYAGFAVCRGRRYVGRLARFLSPDRVDQNAHAPMLPSGADHDCRPPEAHDLHACGRLRPILRRAGARVLALALSLSLVTGACLPHYSYAVIGEVIAGLSFGEFAATYLVPSLMAAFFGVSVASAPWYDSNSASAVNSVFGSEGDSYDWAQGMYANYTASGTGGTFTVDGLPQSVVSNSANWYASNASSFSGVYSPVAVVNSSGSAFNADVFWNSDTGIMPGYSVSLSAVNSYTTSRPLYYMGCQAITRSNVVESVIYFFSTYHTVTTDLDSERVVFRKGGTRYAVSYNVSKGTTQVSTANNAYLTRNGDFVCPTYLNPSVCSVSDSSSPSLVQPDVSSVPSAIGSIASGIASGILSTGEAVNSLYDELTGATVNVGAISPDLPWSDVVAVEDVPPVDPPLYIPILSDIAQGIADILAWLASAIFNANVLSFADGALTSLVDAFGLSGLFASVVAAVEALPDAISWPWSLVDLEGIGEDVVGGVVGGILAGLGIEGGVTFWDQLSGVLGQGIGVDVLGWDDLVGAVTGIGADVVDIPAVLTGIGNDVIGAIGELSDILTGGINVTLDWTLDALRAALEGLGVNVLGLDLTGVLDAIAALPADIAAAIAAALGLDWWVEQADELRPELPDTDLLVLPQATWEQFLAVFEGLAVVRVVNGFQQGMLSFFDTLGGGTQGRSDPPRYEIDFSVLGYPVHFVIDFGVFSQQYILYAHGFMYCLLFLWLFGFSERVHRWMSAHIASLLGID